MGNFPDPVVLMVAAGLVGLSPFLIIMITSFVKLVVVFSLIRNALGIQQIPPNIVLHGLAIILSLYIMAPVGMASYGILEGQDLSSLSTDKIFEALGKALVPFKAFLSIHSSAAEKAFFIKTANELWPQEIRGGVSEDNMLILMPAFTVSELTSAFKIGFLIYLPFIAIDLIISNILLAMGMMMVSPMTISLPFKLLLFVLLDGWTKLIHGLVLTYQ